MRNFSSDEATFFPSQVNQFYLVYLSGKIMAAHFSCAPRPLPDLSWQPWARSARSTSRRRISFGIKVC